MKNKQLNLGFATIFGLALLSFTAISCNDDNNDMMTPAVIAPDVNFTALASNNTILTFNARNLGTPTSTTPIVGLAASETIVSIDYRPATGQLYALGSSSRLYFINEKSGVATALGAASFSPVLAGGNASLDFNPTVDRIRLVTDSGQNLRLHPELGTVVVTDGIINGGVNAKIGAVAYTNSMAGATATMLYDIDFEQDKLYMQTPPNDGTLQLVGDLGVNFQGVGDMDILADNSTALAVTNNANVSTLYTIDLTTGKAVDVGKFTAPVISLAFKTNPIAYATTTGNMLVRFNPTSGNNNSVALTGLAASESIVGLDFRPANGALYAISNQSRLFSVNTASGALTVVGSTLVPGLSGTAFGFDFNPTVDRIRLVSNTGQNLRLHPDLGTVVAVDGNLNPGTPFITGAAYTNNIAGATTTALFVIDSQTDMLFRQDPPNNGTLVAIGNLGVNVDADSGFDIGGNSATAFALLKVNSVTSVYSINMATGAATKVSDVNIQATAMAVGLGF
jgi:WD40 repeat protein